MIAKSQFGELRPVHALAEKVQLGETDDAGMLTTSAITRGLTCLERFKQLIDSTSPEKIRIVGTNALAARKKSTSFYRSGRANNGRPY
jgi:exopolyphosphatase/guanosine-5'-triphosphate,3'-diphosphate pyrophosphatase